MLIILLRGFPLSRPRPVVQNSYVPLSTGGLHQYHHKPIQRGHTRFCHSSRTHAPIGIRHGTLQGDPLSLLLFDLMIEPLIRWLNASQKGYDITSCGLRLASKWYANDGTLVTNTIEDMVTLLDIVEQFSDWSGIRLNVGKCKITAYMQKLQPFRKKVDKDDALRTRLAHITLGGQRIGVLT